MKSRKNVLALAVAVILCLGTVGIATSSPDVIKERQKAMTGIREAMGALVPMAKGEAPFDAAVVGKNAEAIEGHLKEVSPLFPKGSGEGEIETWAKPEIWANFADFEEKLKASEAAARALKAVTEESAYPAALGQLGQSCKACHMDYRRPKD